ncbi:hypothetical protein SDRG_16612 [Saprolegnia diclina VS20]|uniref:Rhodanese domain-containing protein n=1 Tax=Saprolegnia diclina (strain VS20) TaxID=1156394 RepID=T0PJI4_SAPDV|nr:hypothetical protein SDRG_16612 [Saprolegnia diclina VS20]EQC25529.1 hypothetical protein SDRG_16612 [Saprolegnia diclina VS20]|eukprot:XP_008621050.1 hypothetical protein SDRG_16612 [Saprolegnia diclina VS20]
MCDVLLYYKYAALSATEADDVAAWHERFCGALGLHGRVRIAEEGINGTLGGPAAAIDAYIAAMEASAAFGGLAIDWKRSAAEALPFDDLLIRRTKEIVSIELPDDMCHVRGTAQHLSPTDFDAKLTTDNVAVIDVRNDYEYNIGHFQGALNPRTRRFGQFPVWVRETLPQLQAKSAILMYCTGGIRCEKASAYLRHLGLENVYQLEGGIHRYLETFPDGGHFLGKNFVFDQRVAMASRNDAVVGKCSACDDAHDAVSGTRCAYCRTHVLLCDGCVEAKAAKRIQVLCGDHAWMGDGSSDELVAKHAALEATLSQHEGPKGKGRRRSIRKQMDAIEKSLDQFTLVEEGPSASAA